MQALMNLLAKAAKKMQARELEKKKLDFDEESQWMLEKLMEEEDELHTSVADFLDMIIGSHKQMFYPTWKQIWPAFKQMLDPKNNVLTRHTALMVMDDVIEQIGMVGVEFFKQYHDILCLYMGDADPTLRQGAAYGLGVMAGVMETKFRPLVEPTINRLVYAIENSDMKDPRSTSARDNMVVAIGRITKFANVPQLWSKWLSFLPLLHDQDEGGATYAQLCDLVEASEPNILGPQGQNRVHILGIGLHIMADEGWCGSEDVMKRIQTIVYHLITALGANTVQQLVQQNKFSQLQVHNLTAMMQHMQ
jgi:hypothetical protein